MRLLISSCLAFYLLVPGLLNGQINAESITLNPNRVKVVVNSNGAFFWDFSEGQFIAPFTPGEPEVSTLKASGLWMAGLDPGNNLIGAIQLYNTDQKADFTPGVLNPDDLEPIEFNGIWRVTYADVMDHLDDFNDNGQIDDPNPAVYAWPARGNPFFSMFNGGLTLPENDIGYADFFDRNADSVYDPSVGDYPMLAVRNCENTTVVPTEMIWFAFHDKVLHTQSQLAGMNVEVHGSVFGFNCAEDIAVNNTIFTKLKVINRATESIDSTFFGIFNDFDIGNSNDDFFGADTLRNLIFGYNGDADDEGGYGTNAPAMSVDLLRGPINENGAQLALTKYMAVPPGGSLEGIEYYRLLSGSLPNGVPAPNNGIYYPGDPNDPTGNSEVTAGNSPGDRRTLISSGPFQLNPGAVNELIAAYTFHQSPQANDPLENVAAMYGNVDQVQAFFDACLETDAPYSDCSLIVSTDEVRVDAPRVVLFPNPTKYTIDIQSEELTMESVSIFDIQGKLIRYEEEVRGGQSVRLDVSPLAAGMYIVKVQLEGNQFIRKKLIVQ